MRSTGPALFALAVVIASVPEADGAGLEHIRQYTNTSDVRSIALSKSRVWAATGGGLSVHDRKDGRFLFKLTSADQMPGNSLRLVAPLSGDRMLVGGDYGAVVLRHADARRQAELPLTPSVRAEAEDLPAGRIEHLHVVSEGVRHVEMAVRVQCDGPRSGERADTRRRRAEAE